MKPLDQATLLEGIRAAVDSWAQSLGGEKVTLAPDPWNAVYLLADKVNSFRVVLAEESDENVAPEINHQATMLATTISAKLIANPGYDLAKWQALVSPVGGGARPALLTLSGALRAFMLGLRFDPELVARSMLFYRGKRPVTAPGNLTLEAWDLRFLARHAAMLSDVTTQVQL